mmetsp:Transcript_60201/g.136111  ORF Transcript_60201/g.136111 Transcript_60201/m.136111 type:complete len:228 (-) Transcript_60201:226-909(-)
MSKARATLMILLAVSTLPSAVGWATQGSIVPKVAPKMSHLTRRLVSGRGLNPESSVGETPSEVAKVSPPEKKHMSIPELLREYGIIALAFHFTVWATCTAMVFTAISLGFDLESLPFFGATPDVIIETTADMLGTAVAASEPISESAAVGTSVLARIGATLAIVELVGPFRLALTVAVTPRVSEAARKFRVVRSAEAKVLTWIAAVRRALPGGASPDVKNASPKDLP